MNESLFACYDSLFCVGTTQQHIIENDSQATTALYFSGQAEVPVAQPKQQTFPNVSGSAAHANHQNSVGRDDVGSLIVASALNNVNSTATFSNAHNNIPFVQIHTTDVQPQRRNYGNVFRRTVTNQAEIKSEPIKSEAADSSKDRVNATPTPPVRSTSCNSNERVVTPSSPRNEELTQTADTAVLESSTPQPSSSERTELSSPEIEFPTVQKCTQCRYICLEAGKLEEHTLNVHSSDESRDVENVITDKQMVCPGCSNVFFTCKSLEIHLLEDHFVNEADAKKLINAFNRSKTSNGGLDKAEEPPIQARKSRIYLKNVECLREPRREPLEIDGIHHNHMTESFYQNNSFNNSSLERHMDLQSVLTSDFSDEPVQQQIHAAEQQKSEQINMDNRPKQKISIKSVDVLREPALLRRDYEMQNQYCNMANNCNELSFDTFNGFQPPPPTSNDGGDTICDIDQIENNISSSIDKQQRRPKIYIKNVDILKEPLMLPTFSSTLGLPDTNSNLNFNFMTQGMQQATTNSDFMHNSNNQVFDGENIGSLGGPLTDSFLYENSANVNDHHSNTGSNLLNDIAGVAGLSGMAGSDNFQSYGNNNGQMNSNFLTYPLINCNGIDTSPTTPIITEPTPPPTVFSMQPLEDTLCNAVVDPNSTQTPPKQKQKIFIKNVDILKEPQFQEQRERGTLHLRTVDELNLMNRNEVENLIAPNLENNNGNSYTTHSQDATELAEEEDHHQDDDGDDPHPEQDIFYDENSMKLHDYATQLVNSWSPDGYDLGDDLDCMITESIEPITNVIQATFPSLSPSAANSTLLQKVIHDLDTPQVSMISIRDIEELTGPLPAHPTQQITVLPPPMDVHAFEENDADESHSSMDMLSIVEDDTEKPCISPTLPENSGTHRQLDMDASPNTAPSLNMPTTTSNFNLTITLPPLVPVSTDKITISESSATTASSYSFAVPTASASVPVPPLVPVLSLKSVLATTNAITSTTSASTTTTKTTPTTATTATETTTTAIAAAAAAGNPIPAERGRIYVANNLMQVDTPRTNVPPSSASSTSAKSSNKAQQKSSTGLSMTGGTSVRGRPFGSNRADNSNKAARSENGEVVLKCSVRGCAFRFKKPESLDYHKRCHDSNASSSSQAKICPECKSTDFSNWNTLHTHLWRSHQIDMELYSCPQCPFKTPIYSRLVNTHTKIHSEERNFKCEQCGKAFKNTKQLKNHRRWHRTHGRMSSATTATSGSNSSGSVIGSNTNETIANDDAATTTTANVHRCFHCGATFSHQKTLREHSCKKSDNKLLCSVCGHIASSKSSLKLHMFTHENSKRLKCSSCTYSTSDHNAFRRHKMTHENKKTYVCPHCNYKSIQSVTFQKHVLMKHPESAQTLIHKCKICTYSTVNRSLFNIHQLRHKSVSSNAISNDAEQSSSSSVEVVEPENGCESVHLALCKSSLSSSQINNNNNNSSRNNNNNNNNNILNNNNNNNDEEQSKGLECEKQAQQQQEQPQRIKVKNDLMNTFDRSASMREQTNVEWYGAN